VVPTGRARLQDVRRVFGSPRSRFLTYRRGGYERLAAVGAAPKLRQFGFQRRGVDAAAFGGAGFPKFDASKIDSRKIRSSRMNSSRP